MFHVKHAIEIEHIQSLADAKRGEEQIEHFLHAGPPGDPADRLARQPEFLADQLSRGRRSSACKCGPRSLEDCDGGRR